MEDKMTISIDIPAPSSSERRTESRQTLQQAAASPLSPESSVAHPSHHNRPAYSTAVGGRGCFSAVSKNVAKIVILTENSRGMKRPPSC